MSHERDTFDPIKTAVEEVVAWVHHGQHHELWVAAGSDVLPVMTEMMLDGRFTVEDIESATGNIATREIRLYIGSYDVLGEIADYLAERWSLSTRICVGDIDRRPLSEISEMQHRP